MLALPLSQDLPIRKGDGFLAGHWQLHLIQCGVPLYPFSIHHVVQFQRSFWSVRMVHHFDGEVLLHLPLFEGLALHPLGDDLRCLVIVLVDQPLDMLEFGLDALFSFCHRAVSRPARAPERIYQCRTDQ